MARYLHRAPANGVPGVEHTLSVEESFPPELQALGEFLSEETWPDGSERARGSLTMFVEGGKIKVCLSDKDAGALAFVSAGTFDELLQWVEQGIRTQQLDWRAQRERRR